MKRKLFTLVSLLMLCIGGYAAGPPDWAEVQNFDGSKFSKECVVYADLTDANGVVPAHINRFTVGAFIGGELRGVADGRYDAAATHQVGYFPLRIKGEIADNGKPIEFRLVERDESLRYINTYKVAGTTPVKFQAESTVGGTPSNLYHLRFISPTAIGLDQATFNINVGATIDLKPHIKLTPANATMPEDISFSAGNWLPYFTVTDGHILKGVSPNAGTGDRMTIAVETPNEIQYDVAQVIVHQPITALVLNPDYKDGITVAVGDDKKLNIDLYNCYTVTPANATEQPVWSSANTEAISADAQGYWTPKKPGTYNMTLKSAKATLTVPVHITQPVTGLTATLTDIYVNVGDEVTALLKVDTKVQPANATNPVVNYDLGSTVVPASILVKNNDGTITATQPGTQNVVASNPDIPNAPVIYTIHVQTKVTSFRVKQPAIAVLWQPGAAANMMNITAQVRGNFTMLPSGDYHSTFYKMAAADATVLEVLPQDTGYQVNALKKGSSKLTLTRTYKQTKAVNGKLVNNDQTVTGSFTVNIVSGLTGFTASEIRMGNTGTYELQLTPMPADATFTPSLITLGPADINTPQGWTMIEFKAADATGLKWTLTPRSVIDQGTIGVYYDQQFLSSIPINVGQTVTAHAGWQWKTIFAGSMRDLQSNPDYKWDELQEIRTQYDLLYNDDQYGYFGTLNYLPEDDCFKMRLKDGAGDITFTIPTRLYSPTSDHAFKLLPRWSWMGYPYQYSHPLAEVMGQNGMTFAKGDRLASLDAFAEYDGTKWTGTLTMLKSGEGYMFYNAGSEVNALTMVGEHNFAQPAPGTTPAKRMEPSVWVYNSGQFANNMTIVADVPELALKEACTIGAFVGDECRGQGTAVDGKFFITVHGEAGEPVSFKLYNNRTAECRRLTRTLSFSDMAGSIASPVKMQLGEATAIDALNVARSGIAVIDGRLSIEGLSVKSFRVCMPNGTVVLHNDTDLTKLPSGVYLVTVVTTDGHTLTKKVVR